MWVLFFIMGCAFRLMQMVEGTTTPLFHEEN